MATLDSSPYRRQDATLSPLPISSTSARRATVSSPHPSFAFSNTFETHRPRSRTERYSTDRPYPSYRRSTISGHSQGHTINDGPRLNAHADTTMMWSDSASSSPIISNTLVLPGSSPSGHSSDSPNQTHTAFSYEHLAFPQPLPSPINAFSLCPSPEFQSNMEHPRMPPPLLPSSYPGPTGIISHHHHPVPTTTTTPALSPAASSTSFGLDAGVEASNTSSPRHLAELPPGSLTREELDQELMRLRGRVRELEFINDLVRLRVAELESDTKARVHTELGLGLELANTETKVDSTSGTSCTPFSSMSSTPRTNSTLVPAINYDLGPPPSDWPERTAARLKRFCALNRAGNALCAWHDSRRERRAHPPRMAPPQTLNCGCTFTQALFEESLARNGVGAFYPGENVRMDPALRNPLLKLLEERYGYRDGDFERMRGGGWRESEDGRSWEQRAANSRGSSRRER